MNGEDIVRAYNMHDELVAALKVAVPKLEALSREWEAQAARIECGYVGMPEINQVKAALAKAEATA